MKQHVAVTFRIKLTTVCGELPLLQDRYSDCSTGQLISVAQTRRQIHCMRPAHSVLTGRELTGTRIPQTCSQCPPQYAVIYTNHHYRNHNYKLTASWMRMSLPGHTCTHAHTEGRTGQKHNAFNGTQVGTVLVVRGHIAAAPLQIKLSTQNTSTASRHAQVCPQKVFFPVWGSGSPSCGSL